MALGRALPASPRFRWLQAPWVVARLLKALSPPVFTWPPSLCVRVSSLIRTLSLDVGPALIQYDLNLNYICKAPVSK